MCKFLMMMTLSQLVDINLDFIFFKSYFKLHFLLLAFVFILRLVKVQIPEIMGHSQFK